MVNPPFGGELWTQDRSCGLLAQLPTQSRTPTALEVGGRVCCHSEVRTEGMSRRVGISAGQRSGRIWRKEEKGTRGRGEWDSPAAQDTGAGVECWALEVRCVPLAYRMGSYTGAMPGQTRSSGSTWRRARTVRWFCPATIWTCSQCLCLRISSTGVTGEAFCPGLLPGHPFPPS